MTKEGLKNGLVLILDPGGQENNPKKQTVRNFEQKVTSLNFEPISEHSSPARIYLNTLASYGDFRTGSFALSALKRMTGTNSFLGLPVKEKKCQIETFEDCHTRRYVEEVKAKCGCVPWALNTALTLKDPIFCPPNKFDCYTTIARSITGCTVSCTGLYADVQFLEGKLFTKDNPGDLTEKGKTTSTPRQYPPISGPTLHWRNF